MINIVPVGKEPNKAGMVPIKMSITPPTQSPCHINLAFSALVKCA